MTLSETEKEKVQLRGKSLLEKLWDELDAVVKQIFEWDKTDSFAADGLIKLKGEAIGLAKAITVFHQPFFTEVGAVSKEAAHRYKMKKAGEAYQTIGIAERRFEMPKSAREEAVKVRNDPFAAEAQKIPDQHKAIIIKSPKDAKTMAQLFGCSEGVVRYIRGELD